MDRGHLVALVDSRPEFHCLLDLRIRRLQQFTTDTETLLNSVLFCSLAVLDPRVGHTMDVLSPFISILCHSD